MTLNTMLRANTAWKPACRRTRSFWAVNEAVRRYGPIQHKTRSAAKQKIPTIIDGTVPLPRRYQPTVAARRLASRANVLASRRNATASTERPPCLQAFRLPRGAPLPTTPPCIRQRRLPRTAGDRHGLPERVRAPQRGLRCMGDRLCMGSFVTSCSTPPSPRLGDDADDRLASRVDGDALDPDHLRLPLAPVPVERLQQHGVGAGQPTGLAEVGIAAVVIMERPGMVRPSTARRPRRLAA